MIIGILKEIKSEEHRVCMTPSGVTRMVGSGHAVVVEAGAGKGSGYTDDEYVRAGAVIEANPAAIYARAEMVMHVKEPQFREVGLIRPDQILFTFLHLAANEALTRGLIKAGSIN
ncbi:MAG: alanine dehydrogenase, partial [Desulfatitalea sp.]|nr:alanine dehydrogenase [Desulfatitalea sp.]